MDYDKLTVVKLKEELKNRDIPLTNLTRKQQFIDRLVQDDAEKDAPPLESANDAVEEPAEPAHLQADAPLAHEETSPSPEPVADSSANPAQPDPTEEKPITESNGHTDDASLPVNDESAQEAQSEVPEAAVELDTVESKPQPATPATTDDKDPVLTEQPEPAEVEQMESVTPENRKRKRRSITPPVSQETVTKKLKQDNDPVVHLEEEKEEHKDVVMPDAPLDEPTATVQPMATSDDVVEKDQDEPAASRATRSPNERRFKALINAPDPDVATSAHTDDIAVSPALHSATRALYIRDLVRPINPAGLRDHVEELARPPDHASSDSAPIEDFWVDALRTHAFFLFTSISAASRARAGIHARVWPPEPTRKPLWADFFPEEQYTEWVEMERASGGSRPSQAKRWEVAYDVTDDRVDVNLVEVAPGVHRPSIPTGTPTAPTGPRGSMSSTRRPSFPQGEFRRPSQPVPPRPSARAVEEASAPFLELDKLFRFTTTKPKLYWQPVNDKLADDRLDELDRETSRDWDPRRDARENGDSLGRGLDQLKRYTFEDGDVIVDGGPEFGGGGRPSQPRGGRWKR